MQPLPAAARRSPFRHLIVAAVGALGLVAGAEAAEYRSTVEAATVWYDAPSTKARRLYVVGRGYPVEVLVTLEGWIKVRDAAGSIGWVEAKALGPKRMLVVRAKVADVRNAPDETSPVAYRAAQNVLLEWMETLPNGWTRVRHGEAGIGFVRSQDVFG